MDLAPQSFEPRQMLDPLVDLKAVGIAKRRFGAPPATFFELLLALELTRRGEARLDNVGR